MGDLAAGIAKRGPYGARTAKEITPVTCLDGDESISCSGDRPNLFRFRNETVGARETTGNPCCGASGIMTDHSSAARAASPGRPTSAASRDGEDDR